MNNTRGVIGFIVITAITFTLSLTACEEDDDENRTPTADDFVIGNLSQTKGNINHVTITPKSGKSKGKIYIYYDGYTALPTECGDYAVTFNVTAASGWEAAEWLSAGTLGVYDAICESISALSTYLSSKPDNTHDTPYKVKLNADYLGGVEDILKANDIKYVNLDLSDSKIKTIPNEAFKDCSSLTSVIIPKGVTTIGENAFYGCFGLTSVTIPNGVTTIGDHAFNNCISLSSITIPNSVTSIGVDAFSRCTSLTSVTIPNSVTSISSAFAGCTSLANVTIGNGVTTIGAFAFYGCTRLTSVTIPNSVTSIGDHAFRNCSSLTSLMFQGTIATDKFGSYAYGMDFGTERAPFDGDLRDKFYATNLTNGTPGTYTTTSPVHSSSIWTKL